MSAFDFTTLVTDRSAKDAEVLAAALAAVRAGTATEAQLALVQNPFAKGAYNYTDLNRVTAAMEYLVETLREYGYDVPYERIVVHPAPEPVRRLPEGYTELEHIQSSGTQYVDTGFKPNGSSRIVLDCEIVSHAENSSYMGARNAASMTDAVSNTLVILSEGTIRSDFYGSSAATSALPSGRHMVDRNKHVTTVGDFRITNTASANTSPVNLFLFATNTAGNPSLAGHLKVYACQIYDNGTLVRDYVPCINNSGAVGLYDFVGGKFYGNAGTGAFVAGPEVLPPEQPEPIDPYTWQESDHMTPSQGETYLANVLAIYQTLLTAPALPQTIAKLTPEQANQIEEALLMVEETIEQVAAGFVRSGSFDFWSGNRPIPTAKSDRGRTWAELDAMGTTWRNWQVASWYLLLYGNLKAEGDVP